MLKKTAQQALELGRAKTHLGNVATYIPELGKADPSKLGACIYTAEGETGDAYIEALVAEIGTNFNLRVATSDSLVQLASIRSGVLRVSARELLEEVEIAKKEMRKHY